MLVPFHHRGLLFEPVGKGGGTRLNWHMSMRGLQQTQCCARLPCYVLLVVFRKPLSGRADRGPARASRRRRFRQRYQRQRRRAAAMTSTVAAQGYKTGYMGQTWSATSSGETKLRQNISTQWQRQHSVRSTMCGLASAAEPQRLQPRLQLQKVACASAATLSGAMKSRSMKATSSCGCDCQTSARVCRSPGAVFQAHPGAASHIAEPQQMQLHYKRHGLAQEGSKAGACPT